MKTTTNNHRHGGSTLTVLGRGGARSDCGDRRAPPGPYRPVSPQVLARRDDEAIEGRRLACAALLKSCQEALFDLHCRAGAAADPRSVRTGLIAAAVLEEVLVGWHETLAALDGAPPPFLHA